MPVLKHLDRIPPRHARLAPEQLARLYGVSWTPGQTDRRILAALTAHGHLTPELLHYALRHDGGEPVGLSSVLHALTPLFRHGLVARSVPPIQPLLGSVSFLYVSTPQGARLVLPPLVYRASAKYLSKRASKPPRWADHAVALGQVRLMTALGLPALADRCTSLTTWRDRQLKLTVRIPARPGKPAELRPLIPDFAVLLEYAWGVRPWLLEIELTHKSLARLAEKFHGYASLTNERRDALLPPIRPHTGATVSKPLVLFVAATALAAEHLRRAAAWFYRDAGLTRTNRPDMWFAHLDALRTADRGTLIPPAAFFRSQIAQSLDGEPGTVIA